MTELTNKQRNSLVLSDRFLHDKLVFRHKKIMADIKREIFFRKKSLEKEKILQQQLDILNKKFAEQHSITVKYDSKIQEYKDEEKQLMTITKLCNNENCPIYRELIDKNTINNYQIINTHLYKHIDPEKICNNFHGLEHIKRRLKDIEIQREPVRRAYRIEQCKEETTELEKKYGTVVGNINTELISKYPQEISNLIIDYVVFKSKCKKTTECGKQFLNMRGISKCGFCDEKENKSCGLLLYSIMPCIYCGETIFSTDNNFSYLITHTNQKEMSYSVVSTYEYIESSKKSKGIFSAFFLVIHNVCKRKIGVIKNQFSIENPSQTNEILDFIVVPVNKHKGGLFCIIEKENDGYNDIWRHAHAKQTFEFKYPSNWTVVENIPAKEYKFGGNIHFFGQNI